MAAGENIPDPPEASEYGIDEQEIRKESSKAAAKARQAQRKAYELRQAAYGAGDPEERQKLLEEAIDREAEAESFGKMAKYMRRGSFQGMAVGAGLGVVPGLTLGMLTGTLVGGLVSLITGGLGAAGGALVGAIHGPFWNVGEVAGKSIQRITGNLPGWAATDEQKWYLEHMLGQAKEEAMPTAHELEFLQQDDGTTDWGSYVDNASSYLSSVPSWMKKSKRATGQQSEPSVTQRQSFRPATESPAQPHQARTFADRAAARTANQRAGDDLARHFASQGLLSERPSQVPPPSEASGAMKRTNTSSAHQSAQTERRKPRKLENRSAGHQQESNGYVEAATASTPAKKQPRKLERRT